MKRKSWMGIGAIAVLVFALGGYMSTKADGFDSTAWKSYHGDSKETNRRSAMLPDLKKLLRPGMSRQEIVELLGEPEDDQSSAATRPARWTYWLGQSPYGLDEDYFVIEFDAGGRLAKSYFSRS